MPPAVVRHARSSDLDSLRALGLDPDRARVRLALSAEGIETALVVEVNGRPRGVLSIRWSGGCDGDERPWFYGAHVHPDHRRHGLGSALWIEGERLARTRGATEASLDVDVGNTGAQRLYERLGWVVTGPHRHNWRALDPETRVVTTEGFVDTVAMRKRL